MTDIRVHKVLQKRTIDRIGRAKDLCPYGRNTQICQLQGQNPHRFTQKYSRLRCLLRVKGLVIGFYLGWSGHTLLIRKI